MNTTPSPTLAVEAPVYAQLQRDMHNALVAQHPEWILPNGDSPTRDLYELRFAQLLNLSLAIERTHSRERVML